MFLYYLCGIKSCETGNMKMILNFFTSWWHSKLNPPKSERIIWWCRLQTVGPTLGWPWLFFLKSHRSNQSGLNKNHLLWHLWVTNLQKLTNNFVWDAWYYCSCDVMAHYFLSYDKGYGSHSFQDQLPYCCLIVIPSVYFLISSLWLN